MIEIISGPCSAESEAQVLATAAALSAMALPDSGMRLRAFRAGLWKPRTRPGSFEGVGETGIPWLLRVQREYGLPVAVEVVTPAHLEAVLKAGLDMVWVGARTTTNPFAVQELADALRGVDIPVFVKNPVNPDPSLWIGAIERFRKAGVSDVAAVLRGFSGYEESRLRNAPKWQIPIAVKHDMPDVPMYCDPSHICGCRQYIAEVSQRALDLGFDGFMIESHCCPDKALSDAAQQLSPDEFGRMLASLTLKASVSSDSRTLAQIAALREQIDVLDDQLLDLLSRRMQISSQLGECKKKVNLQVLQPSRWDAVLEAALAGARERGLDESFVREVFTAIHQASIDRQV